MGGGHDALPVQAVPQPEGVAEFVQRLFDQPFGSQSRVRGQAIKLLAQAANRHQAAGPAELRFAENEREHGDEQVQFGDPEQPDAGIRGQRRHGPQDEGRMILAPVRIERDGRVENPVRNVAGDVKHARQRRRQGVQKLDGQIRLSPPGSAHRHQVDGPRRQSAYLRP